MRTLQHFVVELKKRSNDTIKTDGGLELYLDTRFEEFKHRVNEAVIVSTPQKYDTGAKPGDILYFHHHVVTQKGQQIDELKTIEGLEDKYLVYYHPDDALSNQSFCYMDQETKEVHPLGVWTILEPIEEKKEEPKGLIEVVKLKEDPVRKAKVAFESDFTKENDLKVGDVVGFPKGMDYNFKIDEKVYFRTRNVDILYVER